jgi:hypothetical protein
MDVIVEKLVELQGEMGRQRSFWEEEKIGDETERLELLYLKEVARRMEAHMKTDDAMELAGFIPLVLGLVRSPLLCMFLLALAGKTTSRWAAIPLAMLAFVSHPAAFLIYVFGGRLVADNPAELGSALISRLRSSVPAALEGNAGAELPEGAVSADLPSGMGCCGYLKQLFFWRRHEEHIYEDVEAQRSNLN